MEKINLAKVSSETRNIIKKQTIEVKRKNDSEIYFNQIKEVPTVGAGLLCVRWSLQALSDKL